MVFPLNVLIRCLTTDSILGLVQPYLINNKEWFFRMIFRYNL